MGIEAYTSYSCMAKKWGVGVRIHINQVDTQIRKKKKAVRLAFLIVVRIIRERTISLAAAV